MLKEVREQLVELVKQSIEAYGSASDYYADQFFATAKAQGLSRKKALDLWDEIEDELPEECFAWQKFFLKKG